MTQLGVEAKSESELDNLEHWIAQKRAEIARDKEALDNRVKHTLLDDKENYPTNSASVTSTSMPPRVMQDKKTESRGNLAPPISGRPRVDDSREPLLFKLGDDYRISKAKYNTELKDDFKNTRTEQDALKRALNRQSKETKPTPYFEVLGQDLFQKRPSTAQVKAAKQAAYKRELEAQLRERNAGSTQKKVYTPPAQREIIIQDNTKYNQLDLDKVRSRSPPPVSRNNDIPAPLAANNALIETSSDNFGGNLRPSHNVPAQYPYTQIPPGYGMPNYAQSGPPSRDTLELSSAIDKATMQMNMDQARLDVSANTARTPRETFYPPPIQSQPHPEHRK